MKPLAKMTVIVTLIISLIPTLAHAKRQKEPSDIFKEAPVSSVEPYTFTRTKTIPGPIDIEFSLVTLKQYEKDVNKVFEYTFTEIEKVASLFNSSVSNSDLARMETAAGTNEPVQVSKETLALASHAKEIADWTRGAFDPVRGPGTYNNLKINKEASTLYLSKAGLSLDLKGILEGFMADLFIRAAYHANLDDAFVKINGVNRSLGHSSYGPWQTVISGNGDKMAKRGMKITISNYSAATAGGKYYAPAVDPRSGKPVDNPLYAVTVLAKQAATAQGVASSVYIMGPKAGTDLINQLGIRAVLTYKNGNMEKIGRW